MLAAGDGNDAVRCDMMGSSKVLTDHRDARDGDLIERMGGRKAEGRGDRGRKVQMRTRCWKSSKA